MLSSGKAVKHSLDQEVLASIDPVKIKVISFVTENIYSFSPVPLVPDKYNLRYFYFFNDHEFFADYTAEGYPYRLYLSCDTLAVEQCEIKGFYSMNMEETIWKPEIGEFRLAEGGVWYYKKQGQWIPDLDSGEVTYFPVRLADVEFLKSRINKPEYSYFKDPVEIAKKELPDNFLSKDITGFSLLEDEGGQKVVLATEEKLEETRQYKIYFVDFGGFYMIYKAVKLTN